MLRNLPHSSMARLADTSGMVQPWPARVTDDTSAGSRSRICVALVGTAALLAILVPLVRSTDSAIGQPLFWDAHAYARALHAYQAGSDPYVRDTALTFVYPPIFLVCANWASKLLHGDLAWQVYLVTNLLALLLVPFALSEGILRSRWFSAGMAVAVFIVHPLLATVYAYKTGNIASTLYAMVFLAASRGLRCKRWLWFHLVIIVVASIKLPLLAFLLLPLLLGEGQAVSSACTAVAVLGLGAAQWLADPAAYSAYLQAVHYQVLERNSAGIGVVASVLHLQGCCSPRPTVVPLLVFALVFGLLAVGMLWARGKGALHDMPQAFTALTLLLALLLNPRMVAYDLVMLAVPMTFLVGELLRKVCSGRLAACTMLGLLGCWFSLGSRALAAEYLAALACFPLAAYVWCGSRALARRSPAHLCEERALA